MRETDWDAEDVYRQQPSMEEMELDVDEKLTLLEEKCLAFERRAESYAGQVTELEQNVAELSGHLQTLQIDLQNKSAKNKNLSDEVCKQNRAINCLQETIQDLHNTMDKKDGVICQLEDYLSVECQKREGAQEEFQSMLNVKDSQIHAMARDHEASKQRLTLQLEEQAQVAEKIADMMRAEQETIREERDMLMCELRGQQQTVCELQEVLGQIPEDCRKRVIELEEKLSVLEAENAYLRQIDGDRSSESTVVHSRSDSWDGRGADRISSEELRRQLDELFRNYENLAKEFEEYRSKQNTMEFEYETRVAGLQIALGSKAAKEGHINCLKLQNGYLQSDLLNEKEKCASLEDHLVKLKAQLLAAKSEIDAMKVVSLSREDKLFKCEREIVRIGQENYLLLEEIQKLQNPDRRAPNDCSDVSDIKNRVIGLRSTLKDTHRQASSLRCRDKQQLAKLTGALEEGLRQTSGILIALERNPSDAGSESGYSMDSTEHFEEQIGSPVQPPYISLSPMADVERELRAILAKSGLNLGHNNPKQRIQYHLRLKQEMEEMRKECVGLLKEKFHLEQCIRYLAAKSHLPLAACFPQDVSSQYRRHPADTISPSSLASSIHYSTPTGRRLHLRGSRGSATVGQKLSPYKPRGSMQDAIRQVQNDTVREARDLLLDFRDVKMCQDRLKECNLSLEQRILSKVTSVCESICNPHRGDGQVGFA